MDNSDNLVYKKIMNYLLDIISRNANLPNFKLPSERSLSVNFDTSREPVRHAYEKLIEHGYVINLHGRGYFIRSNIKPDDLLTTFQKSIKISFIIPSIVTHYSHDILSGVSDFCTENHIEYTIHVSDGVIDKESALLHSIPSSGAMGVILFPADNDTAYSHELLRYIIRKYPFVLVDRSIANINASIISSEDHQAMMDAVQFVHQRNYKHPLYAAPPATLASSIDARINGYTHGLLKYYKIALPRNLLVLDGSSAEQESAAMRHLSQHPDTDIIIVPGAQRLPILNAMRTLQLQSIKLMVFDDELSHKEREDLKPYIIQQDGYHIGYTAAETLYNHILGDMRPVIKRLPVTIIDSDFAEAAPQSAECNT